SSGSAAGLSGVFSCANDVDQPRVHKHAETMNQRMLFLVKSEPVSVTASATNLSLSCILGAFQGPGGPDEGELTFVTPTTRIIQHPCRDPHICWDCYNGVTNNIIRKPCPAQPRLSRCRRVYRRCPN